MAVTDYLTTPEGHSVAKYNSKYQLGIISGTPFANMDKL